MHQNKAKWTQNEANGSDSCNTGAKQGKSNGRFVKGDPRINRNGRPKSFDQCRTLAQEIAVEIRKTPAGQLTTVEAILRRWADSKDFIEANRFLEIAYGKVPDKIESDVNLKTKHIMHWPHERPDLAATNGNRT